MDLKEKLGKDLERNKLSMKDIEAKYSISKNQARHILDGFGSNLHFDGGFYHLNNSTLPNYDRVIPIKIDNDEPLGFMGDTHVCSKYAAMASLHDYYDKLDKAGVKKVFHAGDLTDGYMVYKGQLDDLVAWGEPSQRAYVVKNYPHKKGITTHVIAGNHDTSTLLHGGSNIVENIARDREDIKYCGLHYARFQTEQGPKIDVVHDTARRAYALSYPLQVRQRDTPPDARPDLSLAGHRHVAFYTYYNGEHMYEAGCFENSSPYLRGRGIQATIAGWMAKLNIKDSKIREVENRLLVFK